MTLSDQHFSPENTRARREERRALRWERLRSMGEAAERFASIEGWSAVQWRRTACCGFSLGGDVGLAWSSRNDSVFATNISTCGSVWACPDCAAKIRSTRTAEVEHLAAWHAGQGGTLIMVTLTLAHAFDDPLVFTVNGLTEAWRRVQRSGWWKGIRADLVGQTRSLEVTHGFGLSGGSAAVDEVGLPRGNGWHPHLHLLLLVKPGVCHEYLRAEVEAGLDDRWGQAVVAEIGERHRPSVGRGIDVRCIAADAARYVTKIAQEVTRGDLKSAMRQPWALVDAEDWTRWGEYCAAMKGQRAVVWSKGLRDACGLATVQTDEEVAASFDMDLDEGTVVVWIERRCWNRAVASGGRQRLYRSVERQCRAVREPPDIVDLALVS